MISIPNNNNNDNDIHYSQTLSSYNEEFCKFDCTKIMQPETIQEKKIDINTKQKKPSFVFIRHFFHFFSMFMIKNSEKLRNW